jgi:hypothetical protein
MRLLAATLRKLGRRPATRNTFIALAALLAVIYLSIAASLGPAASDPQARASIEAMLVFPDAYGTMAGVLLTLVGIGGAAYAGAVAGSEWSWNTFRLAIARGESRTRYAVGTLVGVASVLLVMWLLLFGGGVVLARIGAVVGGLEPGDMVGDGMLGRLPIVIGGGWWAVTMDAAIGFTVAFLARSQVAGVAAVVVLYFGEQFAGMIVPVDVIKYAPMTAGGLLVRAAASVTTAPADVLVPLATTTVYLVIAVAALGVMTRRTEVA